MSRSPAAELARLKVTYQAWRITRHNNCGRLEAVHRDSGLLLYADTPGELASLLFEQESRRAPTSE